MSYPVELWADNATGTISGTAPSGSTSIEVNTSTGTFPSPSTNQCFHLAINVGQATAEVVQVTANTSGTMTVSATAHQHYNGEPVAAVVTAAGLNAMLNPIRTVTTPTVTMNAAFTNPNSYSSELSVQFSATNDTVSVQISTDGGSTFHTVRTVTTSTAATSWTSQWLPVGCEVKFVPAGSATISSAALY